MQIAIDWWRNFRKCLSRLSTAGGLYLIYRILIFVYLIYRILIFVHIYQVPMVPLNGIFRLRRWPEIIDNRYFIGRAWCWHATYKCYWVHIVQEMTQEHHYASLQVILLAETTLTSELFDFLKNVVFSKECGDSFGGLRGGHTIGQSARQSAGQSAD